jgi:hypothetical protein
VPNLYEQPWYAITVLIGTVGLPVNRTRSLLYSLARFLGDYQAVKNGRIGKRLARRRPGGSLGAGSADCSGLELREHRDANSGAR